MSTDPQTVPAPNSPIVGFEYSDDFVDDEPTVPVPIVRDTARERSRDDERAVDPPELRRESVPDLSAYAVLETDGRASQPHIVAERRVANVTKLGSGSRRVPRPDRN